MVSGWMVPVDRFHLVVGRVGTSVEYSCMDFGWMVPAQLVVGRSGMCWLSLLELFGWSLLLLPLLGQSERLLLSPLLGQ